MKNKSVYKKAMISLLTSLVLSACGGGGGGGSTEENPDPDLVNNPPTISITEPDIVRVGDNFLFAPAWSDPDGDGTLFSIENQPPWATFDFNTGELSGVPTDDDVETYEDIVITISDGEFEVSSNPFTLTVNYALISRESITNSTTAVVNETEDGFEVIGDTMITVGEQITEFVDAELTFEFDEEGNLIDLFGEADLPPEISDNLAINGNVRTFLQMYTGAEINADPDIGPEATGGILLRDDFRYFVFSISTGIDVSVNIDGNDEEELEFGGNLFETFIVSDLTDPFFYMYGDLAGVGGLGIGFSFGKNIPYQPNFVPDNTISIDALESFDDGQMVIRGRNPIGGGPLFSTFEFQGVTVCRPPQLVGCMKPNLKTLGGISLALGGALFGIAAEGGINDTQQFKLGMNGSMAFDLTVLGFIELFRFELFDMSATLDIGTDFQQLALLGVVNPAESDQPGWIPFSLASDKTAVASAFFNLETDYVYDPSMPLPSNTTIPGLNVEVNGADFGVGLYGEFDSRFPEAEIVGDVQIDTSGLILTGVVDDSENPLNVTATIDSNGMEAFVDVSYDIPGNIDAVVNNGFDSAIETLNEALTDLDNAIADYNGAVSLDGFRTQLPSIIDNTIIPSLNTIPQIIRNQIYNIVYNGVRPYTGNAVAEAFANAQVTLYGGRADEGVALRRAALENLRIQAARAEDTPLFRSALKAALLEIAADSQFGITYDVVYAGITIIDRRESFDVFGPSLVNQLTTAADNVDDIDPAQTVVINTQDYVDSLPTEEIIEGVRKEVEDGLRVIPSFDGVGYTADFDFSQSVFVILSGERIEVEWNPLDPATVVENIGELIATRLSDD